ncbi:MAG: porin family protein, partial [Bacteroidota bacterium]
LLIKTEFNFMNKLLLSVLIVLLSVPTFAQISFEKGYYIDNSGNKVEGLIKNIDWKNNPTTIDFKRSESAENKTVTIGNMQAFEVYNSAKYERHTVSLDVSNQNINDLDSDPQPKWETKQLFLKVLLEGNASLYSYTDGNLRKYFIKKDDSDITQLVFKKYMATNSRIAENTEYKRQLWQLLKCGEIPEKAKKVSYTKNSLLKILKAYNACENSSFVDYEAKVKRDMFNISIKSGINFASVEIDNTGAQRSNTSFENQVGFQVGVEFEYVFNFNRNKWSFVAEPTYVSSYSADTQDVVYLRTPSGQLTTDVSVSYSGIEIPLGFRYYSFLNDSSKLFLNAFYMLNIILDGEVLAARNELLNDDLEPRGNVAFGVGFKYKDTYSIEFRYRANRQLYPSNAIFGNFDYTSFGIILGYTLF